MRDFESMSLGVKNFLSQRRDESGFLGFEEQEGPGTIIRTAKARGTPIDPDPGCFDLSRDTQESETSLAQNLPEVSDSQRLLPAPRAPQAAHLLLP